MFHKALVQHELGGDRFEPIYFSKRPLTQSVFGSPKLLQVTQAFTQPMAVVQKILDGSTCRDYWAENNVKKVQVKFYDLPVRKAAMPMRLSIRNSKNLDGRP